MTSRDETGSAGVDMGWVIRWIAIAAIVLPLGAVVGLSRSANAEDLSERVPVRPGGMLHVDLDGGAIEIESHDGDDVRVDAHATGSARRSVRFDLKSDGVDVRIDGDLGGFLSHLLGGPRIRVRVRVPTRYSVDARTKGGPIELLHLEGDVSARSSGGRIQADHIVGDVDLQTSGGAIELSEVQGDVRVRTSGGPIRISEVLGDVDATTSGGPIEVLDVDGRVDAETSGGPVTVRWVGAPSGRLETSGGGIEAEFPRGAGVDIDARTSGGRVQIDPRAVLRGKLESNQVEAEIDGGGERLQLRTSGGEIHVLLR